MTLSLAAVFIPVLFMGGIMGRLFHEFAVIIMAAILISGVVSLTLTPMLCSRFLKPPGARQNAFQRSSEKVFDGMRDLYGWTLRGVLRHRFLTMLTAAGTLAATIYLYGMVPKGFIPSQDTGQLSGTTEAPQDISFDGMVMRQKEAAAVIQADPDVEAFASSVGQGGGISSGNQGRFTIRLRPRSVRRSTPEQIIERLRPKLNALPGIRTYLQNPPLVRIGGFVSRSLYQYTLQGTDLGELYRSADAFEKRVETVPGLTDVNSDLQISSPQITVDIDRDRASALGVTAEQVEDALYDAYGAREISNIYMPTNTYYVIMELLPTYQRDPNRLPLLYIRSNTGKLVALDSVANLRTETSALTIAHLGQLPAVTISFNLLPGVSLGDAVGRIEELARETLPASIRTSFQGTAAAYQSSLRGMGVLLVMAILVIYMVLGILYESFIHPLTILSGLPSAGLGALATLLIFHNELNIYSFRRHHHADRDRQEERHHDDRLRAGNPADPGHPAGRSHLRGLSGALPAHHDDHHGRAHGHLPHRPRFRRRRRSAPPAGPGRGRRPGGLADADALHHAGVLHLHGALPQPRREEAGPPERSRPRGRLAVLKRGQTHFFPDPENASVPFSQYRISFTR